jgi:hypothetical protein
MSTYLRKADIEQMEGRMTASAQARHSGWSLSRGSTPPIERQPVTRRPLRLGKNERVPTHMGLFNNLRSSYG